MSSEGGAPIPDGWTKTTLGGCLDICRNGLVVDQDADPRLGVPVTRIETISEGRIDWARVGYASPNDVREDYLTQEGDVLLSHINSIKHIGKVARKVESRPLLHGMNLMLLRFCDELDPGFGFALMAWRRTKTYMERRAKKAVNQASLNIGDIRDLRCLIPPLPEQRAIAAVLDSIDEAIERTDELIAATERLRDALVHELLTRGLPGRHTVWRDVPGLGTVPACWDVARLGDVCDAPRYGASVPARPFDPSLPRYVRITDITDDGRLRDQDPRSADPGRVQGYELSPGDLLFARSGSVGRTYLYRPGDGPCVYAGYFIRFRALTTVALPEYLERWTRSPFYRKWVASMFRAGAQPNINAAEYSSLPVALPSLPEQRAIADLLDTVDGVIARTRAECTALESSRASTADALLTGRVRVA